MSDWIPEELYAAFAGAMPICTVDIAFLVPDGRVLLLHRVNHPFRGEWFTPGGRQRKGETLRDCAVRQACAELGIDVDPASLFFGCVYDEMSEQSRFGPGIGVHCVNVCWGCMLEAPVEPRLDGQHDAFAWAREDELPLTPMMLRKLGAVRAAAAGR